MHIPVQPFKYSSLFNMLVTSGNGLKSCFLLLVIYLIVKVGVACWLLVDRSYSALAKRLVSTNCCLSQLRTDWVSGNQMIQIALLFSTDSLHLPGPWFCPSKFHMADRLCNGDFLLVS